MSAGQTSPFFSNIKCWEFLTFFYFVADVANYLKNIAKFETFCYVAKTLAKTS